MSHSQEVLSKLKAQQEAGLFCDITLKTGGGHAFSAHKAVLAAVSEYFQEVFTEMDSAAVPQSYIDLTGTSTVYTEHPAVMNDCMRILDCLDSP